VAEPDQGDGERPGATSVAAGAALLPRPVDLGVGTGQRQGHRLLVRAATHQGRPLTGVTAQIPRDASRREDEPREP
jgi:hypothetical protein